MGSLSARHREDLADLLIGFINKDAGKIPKTILKLSASGPGQLVDNEELESDITELIEVYACCTLEELEIGNLLRGIC